MKSKALFYAAAALTIVGAAGCKPTEQNYRNAYDLALEKRNRTDPDADLIYQGHAPSSPIGAIPLKIAGRDIMTLSTPVRLIDADSTRSYPLYRVAVGQYRMAANARAHAEDLRKAGKRNAVAGTTGEERFFVFEECLGSREAAAEYINMMMEKDPQRHYVGLTPSVPHLIISPR